MGNCLTSDIGHNIDEYFFYFEILFKFLMQHLPYYTGMKLGISLYSQPSQTSKMELS